MARESRSMTNPYRLDSRGLLMEAIGGSICHRRGRRCYINRIAIRTVVPRAIKPATSIFMVLPPGAEPPWSGACDGEGSSDEVIPIGLVRRSWRFVGGRGGKRLPVVVKALCQGDFQAIPYNDAFRLHD